MAGQRWDRGFTLWLSRFYAHDDRQVLCQPHKLCGADFCECTFKYPPHSKIRHLRCRPGKCCIYNCCADFTLGRGVVFSPSPSLSNSDSQAHNELSCFSHHYNTCFPNRSGLSFAFPFPVIRAGKPSPRF